MLDLDCYEILGVDRDANSTSIDEAYWSLAHQYQAGAGVDADRLNLINAAYHILRTPSLRQEFDASQAPTLAHEDAAQARPANRRRLLRLRLPAFGRASILDGTREPTPAPPTLDPSAEGFPDASGAAAEAADVDREAVTSAARRPHLRLKLPAMARPRIFDRLLATAASFPDEHSEVIGTATEDALVDSEAIRSSTAALVARWRASDGDAKDWVSLASR